MNGQTLDILSSSDLTYSHDAGVKKDSVAERLRTRFVSGDYYVRKTGEDNTFWDNINGIAVTAGTTVGVDKGFGSCTLADILGVGGFEDISSYVAGLDGGYLLSSTGLGDMVIRDGRDVYAYWGNDNAVIRGIKSFLGTQKRLGKTIIYYSTYPLGDTRNGYLAPMYAAMAPWCKRNGMFYIDVYSQCPQESTGFLPSSWLNSSDPTNFHLSGYGAEQITDILYSALAGVFNSSGVIY